MTRYRVRAVKVVSFDVEADSDEHAEQLASEQLLQEIEPDEDPDSYHIEVAEAEDIPPRWLIDPF